MQLRVPPETKRKGCSATSAEASRCRKRMGGGRGHPKVLRHDPSCSSDAGDRGGDRRPALVEADRSVSEARSSGGHKELRRTRGGYSSGQRDQSSFGKHLSASGRCGDEGK